MTANTSANTKTSPWSIHDKLRWDIDDVCFVTGLAAKTVYTRVSEGRFPRQHKDGRNTFWDPDDVRRYVELKKTGKSWEDSTNG